LQFRYTSSKIDVDSVQKVYTQSLKIRLKKNFTPREIYWIRNFPKATLSSRPSAGGT